MYPAVLTFNVTAFRTQFPAFATNPPTDATLQAYWDTATCYVSNKNYGWLNGCCRQTAINLMTAHLAALALIIAGGQTPGIVNSATIDKVSVSMTPPPAQTGWQWWLSTTPYGAQLWALLLAKGAGGLLVGGFPERSAYRKAYGVF